MICLNKIVSKINIFNEYVKVIDNHYYNNLLYMLYISKSILYLIIYDITKYKIIKKYRFHHNDDGVNIYRYNHRVSGCFNNESLYIYIYDRIIKIILNNIYIVEYNIDILIDNNVENVLFYINDNVYLCFYNYNGGKLSIFDVNNNKLNELIIPSHTSYSFHQANENIYLKTHNNIYIYNTITNSLKIENCNSLHGYGDIHKISKKCSLTGNLIHNHENNEIIEINVENKYYIEYKNINSKIIVENACHKTNNIIDNIYFYDNWILILSFSEKIYVILLKKIILY